MDLKKAKPLTPGMKMLLEGGGATSFFRQQSIPLAKMEGPKLGENVVQEDAPIPVDSGVAVRPIPVLGQVQPQQPAAQPPAPEVRTCPGPVQLADGRILEPDDYIKLSDACEIIPQLLKAYLQKAAGPGSQVRVAGGIPGVQGVPTPGMFTGLGPLGPYGQAGAGGGFGGGGGSGARGAQGPAGPAGPAGAAGVGLASDPVVKTDGDFTAAAGAFVPVPGSTLTFTSAEDGPVVILVQAELSAMGGGGTQNAQFGLRIDGVDYSLGRRLLHTFAGGVGEFLITQSQMFGLNLAAGLHTVDVLLRGLTAADGGMDIPVMVSANPISPLVVMALHR